MLAMAGPTHVLWHHTWRNALGFPIEDLALRHPMLGEEGYRQIKWSLDAQQEVITMPGDLTVENLALAPYEASADETKRIDDKLRPPWMDPAS